MRWFVDTSAGWCAVLNLGGACIEGTHPEMLALADALATPGTDYRATETYRCAAHWRDDGRVDVSSPRNSITPTTLDAATAAKLAAEIREDIASAPPPSADSFAEEP